VSEYTHFTVAFLGAELDRNCGRKIRGNKKNCFVWLWPSRLREEEI
jgi:hypothetical protein